MLFKLPIHYSIEPRDWIFVKDCAFLLFAKNIGKNIGETISDKYW